LGTLPCEAHRPGPAIQPGTWRVINADDVFSASAPKAIEKRNSFAYSESIKTVGGVAAQQFQDWPGRLRQHTGGVVMDVDSMAETAEPVMTVRTPHELALLRTRQFLQDRRSFELDLPGLSAPEASQAVARLSAYREECGCSMGAWFGTAALVAAVGWFFLRPPSGIGAISLQIVLSLVVLITATGIGKTLGILRARGALHREIDALQLRLSSVQP
jgi:hypothetical protein